MASLYKQQDKNVYATWGLVAGFLIVVIGIGWFFSYVFNNQIILYVAVIFSVVMNVAAYWFSDKIVLKMSGAKQIDRNSHRELWNIVENLSITAGLPVPKIYIINDPAPNAFATGRNKEHAVVAATTGLLEMLDRNEIEGVMAHELAHIGNRDMLLSTVVVVLVGFIAILSDLFIRSMIFGGGRNNRGGALLLVFAIIAAITAPIAATIIRLAISRRREFLADATAALLTRYPEGLASALEKIGNYAQPLKRASESTAHLYISNPFGAKRLAGVSKLFMTHPPTEERIRALRGAAI
jgi:heat shock protein HtpX